jgi:hypothetical protein
MASYLSKPREFTPYIPETNADLYGKLLMKKEGEYEAGVEKVNKNLDYVASLPVAFERERKYLQEKINAITTQLNSNVNTDWSDQATQIITTGHIKDIANDDNVRTAIYNASVVKRGFSSLKKDTENSDGKNVINQMAFMDQYNDWEQNGKLGQKFNGQYLNYQDIIGDFDKYYKDKKPDTRIIVKEAGHYTDQNGRDVYSPKLAAEQWDAVTKKYTEITPDQVQQDFQNFIKSNPNYQAQIDLNATYTYRNYKGEQFAKVQNGILGRYGQNLERAHEDDKIRYAELTAEEKIGEKGTALKKSIAFYEQAIKENNEKLSSEGYAKRVAGFNANPDEMDQARKDLYNMDLYNTVMGKHAYHKDEEVKYSGMSPFRKGIEIEKVNIAKEKLALDQQKERDRLEIANAKALAKQRAAIGLPTGAAEEKVGAPTLSDYEQFRLKGAQLKSNIENDYRKFVYNKFGSDPELAKAFDYQQGQILITDQKTVDAAYNRLYNEYKKGDFHELGQNDIMYFQNREKNQKLYEYHQRALDETDRAASEKAQEEMRKTPEYKEYESALKNFSSNTYLPQDVTRMVRAMNDANDVIRHASSTERQRSLDGVAQSYGFKDYNAFVQQLNQMERYDPSAKRLFHSYQMANVKSAENMDQFKNDYLRSKNYVAKTMFIPWLDPKKPDNDKLIKRLAVGYLKGENAKKFLAASSKDVTAIGYEQDPITGDFSIALKNASGDSKLIPISREEASRLGFQDIQEKDYVKNLLELNTNRAGVGSNTFSNDPNVKSHSYEDAIPLMDNGKQSVRYHIIQDGGTYTVEFWVKDDKHKDGYKARDENGRPLEAVTNSLEDARIAIENFSQSGSATKTPLQYYTASEYQSSSSSSYQGDELQMSDNEDENTND